MSTPVKNTLPPWKIVSWSVLALTFAPPFLSAPTAAGPPGQFLQAKANGESHLSLAMRYYLGDGVPRNYERAAEYFLLAAKAGNPIAQFNAGYMYQQGIGLAVDYVKATIYYQAAANQGYESAFTPAAELYRFMSEEQITEIERQAHQLATP